MYGVKKKKKKKKKFEFFFIVFKNYVSVEIIEGLLQILREILRKKMTLIVIEKKWKKVTFNGFSC